MISSLNLVRFRNYLNETINIKKNVVVLFGNNGEGKTNILESISILADGKGLRRADTDNLINQKTSEQLWSIETIINGETIGVGFSKGEKNSKRIYKINGKTVKNLNEFKQNNHILWMTSENDRLFVQSPANRRNFIDMFCNSVNVDHMMHLKVYEKLIRDRMAVLKNDYNEKSEDTNKWLDILEQQICETGIKVAKNRIKMTEELERCQLASDDFPAFTNKMSGILESEILDIAEDVNTVSMYQSALKERRLKDSVTGMTTLGINRSDWSVHHVSNDINANQCSAGEQKMLLIGIFLSFIINRIKNDNWIILLDDIVAHLDEKYSLILLRYIKKLANDNRDKIDVWLSGTSKGSFSALDGCAQFFEINNGKVSEKGKWL